MYDIGKDVRILSDSLEAFTKRLRKVEVRANKTATFADSFLGLSDTPDSYAGYSGWALVVNSGEDGLHFEPFSSGCVAFVCGAVGWRGTGGTSPRTLIHETAFQLTADGNARGVNAVDLQQLHWAGFLGLDVAAGDYSAILGGEENVIEPGCKFSNITGPYNQIYDTSWNTNIIGSFSEVINGSYDVNLMGMSFFVDESNYVYFFGYGHEANDLGAGLGTLVCWSLIESNEYNATTDYAYNSGMYGLFLEARSEVWMTYLFGESSVAEGTVDEIMWSMAVGYNNYLQHVHNNFLFGEGCVSSRPSYDGFYDGRIVLASDPNDVVEQDSWFSQNEMITVWPVAWTTSRFEFPIVVDSLWSFEAYIVGTEQNCVNVYFWKIEGVIENAGGATTLKLSIITNFHRDVATKEWQVIADDPNDRLVFQFRDTAGPDATYCNLQLSMGTVEVGN